MGWVGVLLALLVVQAAAPGSVTGNFLSPVFNGMCNSVECGKGTCEASVNNMFGFVCNCSPGWSQFHVGDSLGFLPCIVPNCSIDYSCYNGSSAPVPSPVPTPAPPPTIPSLFDPCYYSYCGGGTCVKTSSFDHRCDCHEGFSNLLNVSSFPCYKDCALGGDCTNLGITLSNSSSSTSPSGTSGSSSIDDSSSAAAGALASLSLMWLFSLAVTLASVP